jgi:hypothetical protein
MSSKADSSEPDSFQIGKANVGDLIEYYEIPKEYHTAMFDAYELGARRFMEIQVDKLMEKLDEQIREIKR